MPNTIMQTRTTIAIGLIAVSLTGLAQAQGVYKIVGPDGKVTFSDKPPSAAQAAGGANVQAANTAGASGTAGLPYELRQIVAKFPVTLYTSAQCAPCDSGRTLLKSRGVPFNEKTVSNAEDNEALQRLSGESTLPFATIGGQKLKGYSDAEWVQYLDAAGYPKDSILPQTYRYPAATPLVSIQKAAPAKAPEAARPPVEPEIAPRPTAPSPSNPAGITF
ncbi:glutaredoxin domain-containing protein [Rhodoferax sp.]|uniref:glutaredoxin domain-containing protein n=1 Tax=Rhodoferax sp. TaxID=50421 RepID=UPI003A0FCCD9